MSAAGECTNLVTTARFLGFSPQHIYSIVDNPDRFYTSIQIPKKSNPLAIRNIDIPNLELKGLQRSIYQKVISSEDIHECVHSYVHGRSILTAARALCPGRAVLKMDIKDFFPSITYPRVFGLFRSMSFNDSVSFLLSRLVTKGGCLAQGAPTSPGISNLIMRDLDRRLSALSESWEIKYLRYSDDLFLHKEKNFNYERLSEIVAELLEFGGFSVNVEKTRYHPRSEPRVTLGLLTHCDNPRIPGKQRHIYRSMFFKASRDIPWALENMPKLRGILEWYKCVYGKCDVYYQYKAALDSVSRLRFHQPYKSV